MDEMRTLQDFRADAPTPDRARLAPGHRRLLDEAARPRRRLRGGWLSVVGAAVGVAVAAVLVTQVVPPSGTPRVKADRAASTAVPTDGQWLYEKTLTRQSTLNFRDDLNPVTEKGAPAYGEFTVETWTQYGSGKRRRMLPSGSLDSVIGSSQPPKSLRRTVADLPEEPEEVLKALEAIDRAGSEYQRVHFTYTQVDSIPLESRLSLFRALTSIPGVVVRKEHVEDALGRTAVAVHVSDDNPFTKETHRRQELLLDPETYEYRGERTVMLAGGMIDSKVTTKETIIQVSAVERPGAVNAPGKRP